MSKKTEVAGVLFILPSGARGRITLVSGAVGATPGVVLKREEGAAGEVDRLEIPSSPSPSMWREVKPADAGETVPDSEAEAFWVDEWPRRSGRGAAGAGMGLATATRQTCLSSTRRRRRKLAVEA